MEHSLKVNISIHPPREGWDTSDGSVDMMATIFQSTHPVRGGTLAAVAVVVDRRDFNPPTP